MSSAVRSVDDEKLDAVFHALADRTRRSMLARLSVAPAGVTELAEPHAMTLPAVSKHLKVLERVGLIERSVQRVFVLPSLAGGTGREGSGAFAINKGARFGAQQIPNRSRKRHTLRATGAAVQSAVRP